MIPLMLFVAFPISAKIIRLDPPAPTSETAITALIARNTPATCSFTLDGIDRAASAITLNYKTGGCLFTPGTWSDSIRIGLLNPGTHTISLRVDGTIVDSYDFFVADANSPLKFLPSSKTPNAIEQVQITSDRSHLLCATSGCAKPVVMFGGVAAPEQFVVIVDAHTLIVTTPPHPPGVVTVTVQTPSETITAPAAFRFREQSATPDPEVFERILLPIVYNGFGFGGTWWRTDLAILNSNPVVVASSDAFRVLFYFQGCVFEACPGRLAPGESADAFNVLTRSDAGSLLMPHRDLAPGLRFGYRAWEMFQAAEGRSSGTELPIVREKDFRTRRLDLVQIPLDHHSRVALRIYGPDSEVIPVTVSVFKFDNPKTPVARKDLVLQAPQCATDPCDATVPSFAAISNLEQEFPALASLDRVRVEVDSASGFRFWALATITNNNTQQITLVTPQ
ncbi:MAG: IPT/TIG domain-containing protein [Acidobacteriota bacterium]|nr:IPT/TIG domain-containing protein [Acidobacteriota bacterium]